MVQHGVELLRDGGVDFANRAFDRSRIDAFRRSRRAREVPYEGVEPVEIGESAGGRIGRGVWSADLLQ
jgi:hypothetical protein